tara:strand:+ start:493 stop:882 length:390 start_codon:yes stop_codon:yes gene_type:complete
VIEPGAPIIFNIWLYLMLLSASWGVGTVIFIVILKFYFSKYDKALLKEPYFNVAEQDNYLEFPLSLHKTVIYIHLFSFKRLVRKRFKNPPEVHPGKTTIILSYAAASAIYLQILLGTLTLSVMFFLYLS